MHEMDIQPSTIKELDDTSGPLYESYLSFASLLADLDQIHMAQILTTMNHRLLIAGFMAISYGEWKNRLNTKKLATRLI
jgi:hypothetical protein